MDVRSVRSGALGVIAIARQFGVRITADAIETSITQGNIKKPKDLEKTLSGLEGERLVVTGDSLLRLAEIFQRIAKIVMCVSVIGLEGERLVVAGDCFLQLAKIPQRSAKIAMRLRQVGIKGDGPDDQINGHVVLARLVGDYT